jgi:O-antigen ligase
MSMIATFISLWLYFIIYKGRSFGTIVSINLTAFGGVFLFAFSDAIFSALSRSGDAREITSGTGRAEIWNVVLEYSAQSPILGYGFSSANSILPYDPRLFSVAAHAHNMYLEILFSGGAIGLIIFLSMIFFTIKTAIRNRQFKLLSVFAFFLIRGITEATPFSGVAGYNTFLLCVIIAGIYRPNFEVELARRVKRTVQNSKHEVGHAGAHVA